MNGQQIVKMKKRKHSTLKQQTPAARAAAACSAG
jgi:hypothetical protein